MSPHLPISRASLVTLILAVLLPGMAQPAGADDGEPAPKQFSRWSPQDLQAGTIAGRLRPIGWLGEQNAGRVPSGPDRRTRVSIILGGTSSGPAGDLERAMRTAAFDGSQGLCIIFCVPGVQHPVSYTGLDGLTSWNVSVQTPFGRRYGIGVVAGRSPIGSTAGLDRSSYARLDISYAVTGGAVLFTFQPVGGVRLGIGPGVFRTTFADRPQLQQDLTFTTTEFRITRPALVAEASLTWPTRSRVFAEVSIQERLLARQAVGPFEAPDTLTGTTAVLPRISVGARHWFLGIGAGVRF